MFVLAVCLIGFISFWDLLLRTYFLSFEHYSDKRKSTAVVVVVVATAVVVMGAVAIEIMIIIMIMVINNEALRLV